MNKKRLEILGYLIKYGADVNDKEIQVDSTHGGVDTITNTALELAIEFGMLETV
jgi:hypothetical protein